MAAYAALVSLMHIIENLQLHPRPPISLRKEQVESLTAKVSFLQEFLEGNDPHVSYSAEADPLESRIAEAAHAAEDVIEFYIVDRILDQETGNNISKGANAPKITNHEEKLPSWRPVGTNVHESLEKVIEAMALVEKDCMGIKQTLSRLHTKSSTLPDFSSSGSSSSSLTAITQKKMMMVGADNVLLEMKSMLTSDAHGLQVIPIVGMGGSGKTTLAISLYQDPLIKEHFDICAWTTISQEYSIKQTLIEVLGQLNQNVDQHLSEGELGEMLHKHLFGRKYLVIMDDLWNIDVCDVVKRSLPDNKNGSRIVITTRLSNLAAKLNTSSCLEMKLLNEVHSWDLLSKTVFGEKGCPLDLEETGKKIGLSCKGLPLSIVVVGGLLAKSKHTKEFWENVEENLNSIVNLEDDERCLKILYMSYKQLPVHLKPCFLYMGVFREDKEIYIPRVVKLWVAQGFLKPISGKSWEDVARTYIKDLVDRNLISIDKIGTSGNTKYCRIHDLLRDLSLKEAQKQRFYTLVATPSTPSTHIVMPSTTPWNEAVDALSSSMSPIARSLTWYLDKTIGGGTLVLPQCNMSLLRVLDSDMDKPIHGVHRLVNSRFLDICSSGWFPFSSIWRFWNLQTLIVRIDEDIGYEATIPYGIWYMPHIRHVKFLGAIIYLADPPPDSFVLGNLQTLEAICNFKCSEQVAKRIPNIKKLGIYYTGEIDDDGRYSLSNLHCLDKLESLECIVRNKMNRKGVASLISLPHSLKKITLNVNKEASSWGKGILDRIGVLPLLESLTLDYWYFIKGKWETTEGRFCTLKFLCLKNCEGLKAWTTESSHFPCLEQLRISNLDKLKKIPLDFAEISTLRVIYIQGCRDSAVVSAKRILEEQEELYGEEAALQVQVNFFWGNDELRHFASPNFHFTRN